jgi:hypothetical protein
VVGFGLGVVGFGIAQLLYASVLCVGYWRHTLNASGGRLPLPRFLTGADGHRLAGLSLITLPERRMLQAFGMQTGIK